MIEMLSLLGRLSFSFSGIAEVQGALGEYMDTRAPLYICLIKGTRKLQIYVKAALHVQRFERADAVTKIDSFGSDRKRPRWELNLFLLPNRPKISRLRSD